MSTTLESALGRARKSYRNKNLITGLGLVIFSTSVFFYSMKAVKQDDFSDVPKPIIKKEKDEGKEINHE